MDSILQDLYDKRILPKEAKRLLSNGYLEIDDIAKIDILREGRCGISEIVIAEGKRYPDLYKIALNTLLSRGRVMISRIEKRAVKKMLSALAQDIKAFRKMFKIVHYEEARGLVIRRNDVRVESTGGIVGVITAGTSDIPVAEEAKMVLDENGIESLSFYDVGVAGLHRLAPVISKMRSKDIDAYIVLAGREGTLAALVAGLVDGPVIGVPVSTGYGLGGGGVAAFHSMLQSCAPLVVVNIDAGIVAGAVAVQISNKIRHIHPHEKNKK
jgi:pyridinium-3,5-biscarboxylic acid mononucleotide synthase